MAMTDTPLPPDVLMDARQDTLHVDMPGRRIVPRMVNIRDIAGKLEEAIGSEDWNEAKSALNDLWDWLEHNKLERDGVARMTAEERIMWLDDLATNKGKRGI